MGLGSSARAPRQQAGSHCDFGDRVAELRLTGADVLALSNVPSFRGSAGHVLIHCPAPDHEDRSPSCSVDLHTGRARCFSCGFCAGDTVALHRAVVGLRTMGEALRDLEQRRGCSLPTLKIGPYVSGNPSGRLERTPGAPVCVKRWIYQEADGATAFEVERVQHKLQDGTWYRREGASKPWKTYRPTHPGGRPRRLPSRFGAIASRPLYGLPRILDAGADAGVWIVEGEPAADALASIGAVATTSSGGASAASKTDWSPLAGRHVVVWPDRDPAGTKYARAVANLLGALAPAPTIDIVDVDRLDLPLGGDAVDWLQLHGAGRAR